MTTIKQIKAELLEIHSLETLKASKHHFDRRIGVQKLMAQREKALLKKIQLKDKYDAMMHYENLLSEYQWIAGIDEAGRGPLAGEVVAASVILPQNFELLGLNDSKQLSNQKRMEYRKYIMAHAIYGIGIASVDEIDEYNIYQATKLAMTRAVHNLSETPDYLLIDAMDLNVNINQQSILKGDTKSVSIAAASILAKTERDLLMEHYDNVYPEYDFKNNKGYGTKTHLNAIKEYGVTNIHRKTFEPVKCMMNL